MAETTSAPNSENVLDSSGVFPSRYQLEEIELLQSIDESLKRLVSSDGRFASQSAARDSADNFKRSERNSTSGGFYKKKLENERSKSKGPKSFSEGLESALMDALGVSNIKDQLGKSLSNFAKSLGTDVEGLPGLVGKELGQIAIKGIRSTKAGGSLFKWVDGKVGGVQDAINKSMGAFNRDTPGSGTPSGKSNSSANRANKVAEDLGEDIKDVASSKVKDAVTSSFKDDIGSIVNNLFGDLAGGEGIGSGIAKTIIGKFGGAAVGSDAATGALSAAAPEVAGVVSGTAEVATGSAAAGGALSGLAAMIGPLLPVLAEAVPVLIAIEAVTELLKPILQSLAVVFGVLSSAADKEAKMREERLENEKQRRKDDIETIVRRPFEILQDAAQELYDAWDSNIRLINGTQGYTKDQLFDLMSAYSKRLQQEGLEATVSSADITSNLAKVLQSNLQGDAAVEFAYLATKLESAIPTQDFFSMSSTWGSIAAQQIQQGKSSAEAYSYANQQLETFASEVLYASRVLTGGFTSGLQNASDLFASANKIAQTSRIGDPAQIAAVLTGVSAITGAVSPDLASSLVDAVVSAATGGNASNLVALRSMAGINASNTEFLQALARDPQGIFADMFEGLARMQHTSDNAYMEVAEGLSSIFGLSMDTFARVDFDQLANSIRNMDLSTASLNENLAHLASGETTTDAQTQKIQQINKYMIDEGLSYMMDNEVARMIQQHMWEEQIANEIMDHTFAIEFADSTDALFKSVLDALDNIISLINPLKLIGKVVNMFATMGEAQAHEADIRQILELGKVGPGNAQSLYQLTTRGVDLNLTPDLVTLMGGLSTYGVIDGYRSGFNEFANFFSGANLAMHSKEILGGLGAVAQSGVSNLVGGFSSRGNAYTWGNISKSAASALYGTGTPMGSLLSGGSANVVSGATTNTAAIQQALNRLTEEDYILQNIQDKRTYEDWVGSASKFGIKNLDEALQAVGSDESELRSLYQQYTTQAGNQEAERKAQLEEDHWNKNIENLPELPKQTELLQMIYDGMFDGDESMISRVKSILGVNTSFWGDFIKYFAQHYTYVNGFNNDSVTGSYSSTISAIAKGEREESVFAFADALINNVKNLDDPTLQTNVLLSQILLVVQAIMQQNNTVGELTIPDALAAMATGQFTSA